MANSDVLLYNISMVSRSYDSLKREGPFFGDAYLERFHERHQGSSLDQILVKELGQTGLARIVERNASLSSLTFLKFGFLMRHLPEALNRVREMRRDSKEWANYVERLATSSANNPDFSVVQIGAFDGITNDRLRPLLLSSRWKALLVEPTAEAHNLLRKNYEGRSNISFAQCAITESDGPIGIFRVNKSPNVPGYVYQLSTVRAGALDRFSHLAANGISEEPVSGMSLRSLYEEHGVQNPDFLFIDAEGSDYGIIKQIDGTVIPWPKFLVFEHDHMSDDQFHETLETLGTNGYDYSVQTHDTLAFQRS